ncbi:ATP-dependent sacrificial sulfur transferase LarE [Methanolobus vulcani]|uniref:ATP-dependent sacrificial sulfur transferase LarE n=1 Tax=Methanolobus vulcani TaxID=38026 RepID=A0A7Z8KPF6_9EURY|nr:ATP-dependent sacrificial sulfur transferase LarE [Methanolobus vulcani]TQD26640.1 ATP-dependent sacrificial sulfur transferase LarE [Methanolobus vulcani]
MIKSKIEQLKKDIGSYESALVAFSGGVDSATVAFLAHEILGDKAIAVTVNTHSFPDRELKAAKEVAAEIGIEHRVLDLNELSFPQITENSPERCYYCKKEILALMDQFRIKHGMDIILEGSNSSDLLSYRPGKKAIDEAGNIVHSPLMALDISKKEVRQIASELGLSVAEQMPSPCLASRFPYGDKLTEDGIKKVELAESFLYDKGLRGFRVRDHKGIARIEVSPDDMSELLDIKEELVSYFKDIGFKYVTLDLEGFRSGSMDEVLLSQKDL